MKDKKTKTNAKVKVLYQYLNGRWYAFADVGDEIFVGQVPTRTHTQSAKGEKKPPKGSRKNPKVA